MSLKSKIVVIPIICLILTGCAGWNKTDASKTPVNAQERARKNVEEGKGISLESLVKGRGGNTNYEFSTSNPMWRASLEILDFLPMTTVDYSGGMIISDWYSDENSNKESIKITIRFLSNEVRSDSLKIIVHKKICKNNLSCSTKILENSSISQQLRTSIIKKAALFEKEAEKSKKK